MSRIEMPMGLDRALGRPRPLGIDDAMLLRLERALRRAEPDPLFRRRLRGHLVNRYVASREGLLVEPRRPARQMGKLGRSILYASLAAALSLSAAGAAAQDSLPGESLYAMKLQLEELRTRVAPLSVHAELAGIALAERVEELDRLAAAGAWDMVPAAAARVTDARDELLALDPDADVEVAAAAEHAADVLESVLAGAPPSVRSGLQRALQVVTRGGDDGERHGKPRPKAQFVPGSGRPAVVPGAPEGTQSPNPRSEESGKPSSSPDPAPDEREVKRHNRQLPSGPSAERQRTG